MLQGTRNLLVLVISAGIGCAAAGCANGALLKGGSASSEDLPKELSEELKYKFEVKDAQVLPPGPEIVERSAVVAPRKEPSKVTKKARSYRSSRKSASPGFLYPSRRPQQDPIWMGERLSYEVTYLGMAAGEVTLETLPFKSVSDRKAYWIRGTARSSKLFGLFYRLNDSMESFFDYDGLFSHRFHLKLDESKQVRDALELYDSEKAQTFYWNRWDRKEKGYTETKDFFPIERFPQDSLSAIYFLRSRGLAPGEVLTFPVASEGKTWEAVVTVVRREIMDTTFGRVRTVVLKPEAKFRGVLEKKGDSYLWFTDDDRRFLVRIEARVRIGTVVANLKRVEPGAPVIGPALPADP